jgi:hypothetical protein
VLVDLNFMKAYLALQVEEEYRGRHNAEAVGVALDFVQCRG